MEEDKKFISNIDYNKSSKACSPCNLECEKVNKRINNRKLSDIKNDEVISVLTPFKY